MGRGKKIFFKNLARDYQKAAYHERSVKETLRISIIYDKVCTNRHCTCTLAPTIKKEQCSRLHQTPEQIELAHIVTRSGSPPKAEICFWIHFNAKRSMADQHSAMM